MTKTKITKPSEVKLKWYLIDAKGKRLGKVAAVAAQLLLGKNEPTMRDYLLPQNKVVVLNAASLDITAKKSISKLATRYSGYPGGLTIMTLGEMMQKYPDRVIEKAIRGMLPKNKRADKIADQNLFVYADEVHPHNGQENEFISIDVNAHNL